MTFLDNLKHLVVSSAPTAIPAIAKTINPVLGFAVSAILNAEASGNTGRDKKAQVLEAVINSANAQGIQLNLKQISSLVDNIVEGLNKPL